jgi:antitoxin component YwqK of YwqJK toxin-antitoxin module/peroxiredoxin
MSPRHRCNRVRSLALLAAVGALAGCWGERTIAEHYDSGQAKRAGQTSGGLQVGTWRYWYPDGRIQAIGDWKDDKQFGAWTYWYPDSAVQAEGSYAAGGQRTGTWTIHHAGGAPASTGAYRVDRQDGVWRYWYASGARCAAGSFLDGVRSGLWRTYAADGHVSADALFFRGVPVGTWLRPDGGEVPHSVPAGMRVESFANGADQVWGMVPEYLDRDTLLADPAPAKIGLVVIHHADGSGRAAACDQGHGVALVWQADGALAAAGSVNGGAKDGTWDYFGSGGADVRVTYHGGAATAAPNGADAAVVAAIERGDERGEGIAAPAPAAPSTPTVVAVAPAAPAAPAAVGSGAGAPTASPTMALPFFWTHHEEAAADAVIARYDRGSASGTPELSPEAQLPSFWTKHEEGSAANWIGRYDTGTEAQDPYDQEPVTPTDAIIGKPLPQLRFLGADGNVIDIGSYQATHRPVVVVVMRGFAGQVCLYCAAQTVALCKHLDEFHAAGADVVVVYPGPAESAPAFLAAVASLRKSPPPLPVAMDVSLLLVRGLKVEDNLAKPTSLILDRNGVVRYAYIGRTMADRPSAPDLLHALHNIIE